MSETFDQSVAEILTAYQATVWAKDVDAFVAFFHSSARDGVRRKRLIQRTKPSGAVNAATRSEPEQ